MRRVLLIAALATVLTACGKDNTFEVEDGNCYRTRNESFIGWTYHTEKVLALPQNCEG